MGFLDKVKEVFKKLKDENQGFLTTMKRINAPGFCGNVNRGVSNGDFWNGSYVSIEDGKGVIYGSNQVDYVFSGEDILSFEVNETEKVLISVGDKQLNGKKCVITFKDGKCAYADILDTAMNNFKSNLRV